MPRSGPPRRLARFLAIAAAALFAAGLVVAALAPAALLAAAVASWSRNRVELADVEGTVWRGEAVVLLEAGRGDTVARTRLPGVTSWRLVPWQLLLGTIDLTLANPAVFDAPVSLRMDPARNATVDAGRLHLPAQVLTGLGAPWSTIQPGGELSLQWDTLHVAHGALRGGLRGEWSEASSRLSPIVPFGHYRLDADGAFPGAQVHLETLAGPMEMTGNGTIADGFRLRFRGTAQVRPGTDPAVATQLSGLISLLGPREGNGAALNIGM
jgi:general secretion pathway protein N